MGHAGTDFEIEWRSLEELCAVEATDPLLRSAAIALESGLMTKDEVLALYEDTRKKCFAAAEDADRRPRLSSLEEVMRSEEHTSELQSLMRISYAVFCLKKKKN